MVGKVIRLSSCLPLSREQRICVLLFLIPQRYMCSLFDGVHHRQMYTFCDTMRWTTSRNRKSDEESALRRHDLYTFYDRWPGLSVLIGSLTPVCL
jgi:hypothetical protein